MTPLRSFSSATARRTGSLVAVGESIALPKVSWFRITWFFASSRPSAAILYATSMLSLPRSIA